MRRALYSAICGTGIFLTGGLHLHTKSQSKDKSGSTSPNIDSPENWLKDFETQYDIYRKHFKNYSHSDQRKLRPSFKTRAEHLANLKDPSNTFDILVIGGGSNGAGALLEASTRGFYSALVDNNDFGVENGSGPVLIHGGLRRFRSAFRVQRGIFRDLKLVSNRLSERDYLLNAAPYMNRRLDLAIPCRNLPSLLWNYTVANTYHLIGYLRWAFSDYMCKVPRPSLMSKEEMKNCFPLLKGSYGVRFSEVQGVDNRLLIQALLTATQEGYAPNMKGAVIANYIEFVDLLKDKNGTCIGARLKDRQDGKEFTVRAKVVVNCAGTSSDKLRLKDDPKAKPMTLTLKGCHLKLPYKPSKENIGLLLPESKKGGDFFMLPYKDFTIASISYRGSDMIHRLITSKIDKEQANKYFDTELYRDHTTINCDDKSLVLAKPKLFLPGLRNRLRRMTGRKPIEPANVLTHNYEIDVSDSGLVTLVGSGWTTYRKAGEELVKGVLKEYPELSPSTSCSTTREVRLIGAYTNKTVNRSEKSANEFIDLYKRFIKEKYLLDWDVAENLVAMYGTQAIKVARLGNKKKLKERLHDKYPLIKAQVLYTVKKEMATSIGDIVHLSLIHICRCRRYAVCRSRWSPYH
eukprot:TRINITY_DN8641_c0_g1_i3.p1 TRINITY_DN8641_c0_g1~~TRINITY_DN8641_c0_g1_i3.p1  ORF type:complete len:631 (+),score=82.16 TRINITY_DN8641_c0_g1_i3:211-2103(+)